MFRQNAHERIELVFGAQGSLRLILNCYKGIPLLTKIRVLDSLCKFVSNSILSHFSFFATANDLRVLSTQFDRCKFITPSTSIFVYNTLTMTQITSLCLQQLDLWFCLLFCGGITLHWSGFKVKFRTAERFRLPSAKFQSTVHSRKCRAVLTNGHTGHVPRAPDFFLFEGPPTGCGEIFKKTNYLITFAKINCKGNPVNTF